MRGAVILAGGKSTRIGVNKASIKIEGKSLLRHIVDKVGRVASDVVVVIGKDDDRAKFSKILPRSIKVLIDTSEDGGPIIGMITGIEALKSEYATVLPVDTPLIREDVLDYLFCKANRADAAVPRWPSGWIEPLQAVYRVKSMGNAIRVTLEAGELRPFNAIKRLKKVIYVPIRELRKIDRELLTFTNINTAEDIKIARRLMSKAKTESAYDATFDKLEQFLF